MDSEVFPGDIHALYEDNRDNIDTAKEEPEEMKHHQEDTDIREYFVNFILS